MAIKVSGTEMEVVKVSGTTMSEVKVGDATVFGGGSTETAVGTWVLNETISAPSVDATYNVDVVEDGNYAILIFKSSPSEDLMSDLSSSNVKYSYVNTLYEFEFGGLSQFGGRMFYSTSDNKPSLSGLVGEYTVAAFTPVESTVELRTFTITGGDDASNPDLVAWLKANATKQEA